MVRIYNKKSLTLAITSLMLLLSVSIDLRAGHALPASPLSSPGLKINKKEIWKRRPASDKAAPSILEDTSFIKEKRSNALKRIEGRKHLDSRSLHGRK